MYVNHEQMAGFSQGAAMPNQALPEQYIDIRSVLVGDTVEVGFCFDAAPKWLTDQQHADATARTVGVVQAPTTTPAVLHLVREAA